MHSVPKSISVCRRAALYACIMLLGVSAGCRQDGPAVIPRHQATAVTVTASNEFLELRLDGRMKDVVDTNAGISYARYVAVCDLPRHYLGNSGRALIAGVGSGAIARQYGRLGWRVTVAETDERLVDIARQRFRLSGSGVTIDPRDARTILASDTARFDLVLLDLVGLVKAPAPLMTKEFFSLAARRLREGGMLGLAVESPGWKSEIVALLNTTLSTVFTRVTVLPIAEPPDRFAGIVLLASATVRNDLAIDVDRNTTFHPDWRYGEEYQKTHAWDNHFSMAPARVPVQTDRDNRWEAVFADLDEQARRQPADYLP